MATVFPKKRLQDNEILDIDDTNNAFRDMSQEAGNALGEHNWKKDAFGAADLDPTHALVATSTYHECENVMISTDVTIIAPSPSTAFVVGGSGSWQEVTNLSETIVTGNSLLWIMASFQYTHPLSLWPVRLGVGAEFCIAYNGAPIPETITGTEDPANDTACRGVQGRRFPVVIDTILPVSPGSHGFTLLVRTKWNHHFAAFSSLGWDDTVDNRELIVLEMK